MENSAVELDLKNLVKELSQGRELAKQLRAHLNAQSSSSSSSSSRAFLIQRILYSYDQALSMLTHTGEMPAPLPTSDSLAGTPHSDDSDQDQASRKSRNIAVPRWTDKIKVCPEAGLVLEGQLDDGYAWRKYGQKDILGAKYPRGYYRCSYRHGQGCLATKQVQRCDDDPTTLEITYRRNHTCNCTQPPPDPQNEDPKPLITQSEPLFNIQTGLTTGMAQDIGPNMSPLPLPFNFSPSSSINPENNHVGNDIMENYSSIYTSTSDKDTYGGLIIPNSDSELSHITSTTLDADFPFASSGFGSDFNLGNPGYYP